jgi:hypothetical protein
MVILLLLDRVWPIGGSVEHSEGKGRESIVAILRFLCGSPRSCRLRTMPLWPPCLELCTNRMLGFMGPDKPGSFCNYYVELHLPASCGAFTFWREDEAEGQDFILRSGAQFRHSRDLRMVVIRESLRESSIWHVGQVLSHVVSISIRVTTTLSIMSGSLSLQSSRSMFGVLLVDLRSWMRTCSGL